MQKVFVTGEFCSWHPHANEMKLVNDKGIYEIELLVLINMMHINM